MADSGKTTPLGASGTGSCRSVLSCSSVRRDQDTERNWKDGREWVAGVPQQVRGRRGCASVGARPLGCSRRLLWDLAPNLQGATQLGLPGTARRPSLELPQPGVKAQPRADRRTRCRH